MSIQKSLNLKVLSILMILLTSNAIADEISIFGMSVHSDNNSGKGYEEENWGLAYHSKFKCLHSLSCYASVGAFRNSYDDLASWMGLEVNYALTDFFHVGVDARHWETRRGTYPATPINFYPKVKLKLSPTHAVVFRVGKSAMIISYRFNLK